MGGVNVRRAWAGSAGLQVFAVSNVAGLYNTVNGIAFTSPKFPPANTAQCIYQPGLSFHVFPDTPRPHFARNSSWRFVPTVLKPKTTFFWSIETSRRQEFSSAPSAAL